MIGCTIAPSPDSQTYPSKPIRIVTPVVPGSAPDLRVRQIAPKLAEALGQSVIVENRPGGNGQIAAREAAKAAPDGHTLFNLNINNALNDVLNPDPATRLASAFTPITDLAQSPLIMVVHPSVPADSVKAYIALAKMRPKTLNYGSSGSGGIIQLPGERIKQASGIDVLEVPYKSPGAELPDLLGGGDDRVRVWGVPATLGPHIASGRLRALAVAGVRRLQILPDTPTLAEAGLPGIEALTWNGLLAPIGTPIPIVRLLHAEIQRALGHPDIRDPILASGSELGGMAPEQFATFLGREIEKWGKVVRETAIKLQ